MITRRRASVHKGQPSEPFLMTGFDKKVLHVKTDKPAGVDIEIDFLGDGSWERYERIETGAAGWVRLIPTSDCTATAEFIYT